MWLQKYIFLEQKTEFLGNNFANSSIILWFLTFILSVYDYHSSNFGV